VDVRQHADYRKTQLLIKTERVPFRFLQSSQRAQHIRIQVAPVQRGAAELVVGPEPNGDDAGRAGLFLQGPHQPRAPVLSLERRIDDQRMELPLKLGMPHGAYPTAQGSSFKSAEGK